MKESYYENETQRAERNINKTLIKELRHYNNIGESRIFEAKEAILDIHGMSGRKLDYIGYEERIEQTGSVNDVSIDDNSNKHSTSANGVHYEVTLGQKKMAGYNALYKVMRKLYGKEKAKKLSAKMYSYRYALADSSNIKLPYCWSWNATPLLYEGRPFGQLHSKAVKHVPSYISAVQEVVHNMAGHLAGAIALPTLFIDTAILAINDGYTPEQLDQKETHKFFENEFQQLIHSVNHVSRSSQDSPFTNVSVFDEDRIRALLEETADSIMLFDVRERFDDIVKMTLRLQDCFTDLFMKGDPTKSGSPYRFPVKTLNLNKTRVLEDYDNYDYLKDYANKYDVLRTNIFISEGNKFASCCRLINNSDLMEYSSQSNSFGAGGSVSLGSHRVLTINLYRLYLELIAKNEYTEDNYLKALEEAVADVSLILFAHKELLREGVAKGLHPYIDLGWISLERMFSTVGLLGYWELVDSNDRDWNLLKKAIKLINVKTEQMSKQLEIPINIEQIPAESMSHKLARADKIIFGELAKYDIYSNQFIPMWEKGYTIWDRIKIDGMFNKLINGGGIVHIQINANISPSQLKKVIQFAAKHGCEHIALGGTYATCGNGHTSLTNSDICPICGSLIQNKITRVVGFFTPVHNWSKQKRELDFNKRVHYSEKDVDK